MYYFDKFHEYQITKKVQVVLASFGVCCWHIFSLCICFIFYLEGIQAPYNLPIPLGNSAHICQLENQNVPVAIERKVQVS